jgi:hypothetical protein
LLNLIQDRIKEEVGFRGYLSAEAVPDPPPANLSSSSFHLAMHSPEELPVEYQFAKDWTKEIDNLIYKQMRHLLCPDLTTKLKAG